MRTRFEEWKDDIQKYCKDNNLSFDKVRKTIKTWGQQLLILQMNYPDIGEQDLDGLNTEAPIPVVLYIREKEGSLHFEQTMYTKMYLSN